MPAVCSAIGSKKFERPTVICQASCFRAPIFCSIEPAPRRFRIDANITTVISPPAPRTFPGLATRLRISQEDAILETQDREEIRAAVEHLTPRWRKQQRRGLVGAIRLKQRLVPIPRTRARPSSSLVGSIRALGEAIARRAARRFVRPRSAPSPSNLWE